MYRILTYKGRIITVDGVENDTDTYRETWLIWIKGKGQAEPIADFAPIPLSPSLLEACGFVETNSYSKTEKHFRKEGFEQLADYGAQIIVLPEGGFAYLSCGYYENEIYCQHLHHLQNLYFALTGSELSVNLEKMKV